MTDASGKQRESALKFAHGPRISDRRSGSKTGTVIMSPGDVARFWSGVDVRGADECWEWQRSATVRGYGRVRIAGGLRLPHRVAFELSYGPVPETNSYHGMVVMHSCDNPRCCNPGHLRLGTQQDNVRDMRCKGRSADSNIRGEAHVRAILTVDAVRSIRADKRTETQIARHFGVSRGCVSSIRRRKNWAHVR